jgi:hypothetical protein
MSFRACDLSERVSSFAYVRLLAERADIDEQEAAPFAVATGGNAAHSTLYGGTAEPSRDAVTAVTGHGRVATRRSRAGTRHSHSDRLPNRTAMAPENGTPGRD